MDAFGVSKLLGQSKDPKVKRPVVIHDPANYKKTTKATKPLPPVPKDYHRSRPEDYRAAAEIHPDPEPHAGKDLNYLTPQERREVYAWSAKHNEAVDQATKARMGRNRQWYGDDPFGVAKVYNPPLHTVKMKLGLRPVRKPHRKVKPLTTSRNPIKRAVDNYIDTRIGHKSGWAR